MLLHSFYFACFISFLDFCFQYGNIFDFYKKWLINKFYKGSKINLLEHDLYAYKEQEINSKWYKVLGGCKYCYQFWLGIPYFILFNVANYEFFIIFVSISFTFIKIIDYVSIIKK